MTDEWMNNERTNERKNACISGNTVILHSLVRAAQPAQPILIEAA
jgi:hypothetical protein